MRKSPLNLPSPFSPFLWSCGNSRSRAPSTAQGWREQQGRAQQGWWRPFHPEQHKEQQKPLAVPGGALMSLQGVGWMQPRCCQSPFPRPAPLFVLVGSMTQIFTSKVNIVKILIICSRNERITVGADQSGGCALLAQRLLPARCPRRCSWSPPHPELPVPSPEIWENKGTETHWRPVGSRVPALHPVGPQLRVAPVPGWGSRGYSCIPRDSHPSIHHGLQMDVGALGVSLELLQVWNH